MTKYEPTDEALAKSAKIIGAVTFALGLVFLLSANTVTADVATYVRILGVVFMGLGGLVAIKGVDYGLAYLEKQQVKENLVEEVVEQSIIDNKRGIVWVWVVALTTWAIMAVAYFSLSMVVYMVLDAVEGSYAGFTVQDLGVIELVKNVVAWFMVIMTIGILGWALINSTRRETATYPI